MKESAQGCHTPLGVENNTKELERERKKGKKNIEYRPRIIEYRMAEDGRGTRDDRRGTRSETAG